MATMLTEEDMERIGELLDLKLRPIIQELYGATGNNGMKGDIKDLERNVATIEKETSSVQAFVASARVYFGIGAALGLIVVAQLVILLFNVLTHKTP